jgi:hypothetical protein
MEAVTPAQAGVAAFFGLLRNTKTPPKNASEHRLFSVVALGMI